MPVHVDNGAHDYKYRGANDRITIGVGQKNAIVSGIYVNRKLVYPSTYVAHYKGSGIDSARDNYSAGGTRVTVNYRYSIEAVIKTKNALSRQDITQYSSEPFCVVNGGNSRGNIEAYTVNNGPHTDNACKYVNHDSVEYEVEVTSVDGAPFYNPARAALATLDGMIFKGKYGFHDGYDLTGKHLEFVKPMTGIISDDYKSITLYPNGDVIDLPTGMQRLTFPRFESYIDDFVKLRNYVGSDSSAWHRPYYSAYFNYFDQLPHMFRFYFLDVTVPYTYQGEKYYANIALPMKFTEEVYVNFDRKGNIIDS